MADLRVGLGYDLHAYAAERRLVLGGAEIAYSRGLAGHSDGDVLAHAVADALLGAAGWDDIGEWFPPDDATYRGARSLELLRQIVARLSAAGWRVVNVDVAVVAQEPRLAPYRETLRANLAAVLGVPGERVNVKFTAPERLGALGRVEGVAALATALIERE
ncbi:MAG TPA: 2-C-methyl-D-erythritol 2,4-cyclodiphosphate synthase [Chloroflexota bacterium]|nr:2-C-methyl-D-erythritol 2,4-cyclodiphosphate synthase [Chloroflexota bacterium]